MSLDPFLSAHPAVQVHVLSAIAAVLLGGIVVSRPKGTPPHWLIGRIWAALMVVTATAAIFITEIQLIGPFSPIHIFVIFTYVGLWQGIRAIRRGDMAAHRASMQGVYFGALGFAGAFALVPGRRLSLALFGPDGGWLPPLIAIAAVLAGTLWSWRRGTPKRRLQRA